MTVRELTDRLIRKLEKRRPNVLWGIRIDERPSEIMVAVKGGNCFKTTWFDRTEPDDKYLGWYIDLFVNDLLRQEESTPLPPSPHH